MTRCPDPSIYLGSNTLSDADHRALAADLAEAREDCATERARADALADALAALKVKIETVAPYVLATISPGNNIQTSDPEWDAIHRGRASSSRRQLASLAALASPAPVAHDLRCDGCGVSVGIAATPGTPIRCSRCAAPVAREVARVGAVIKHVYDGSQAKLHLDECPVIEGAEAGQRVTVVVLAAPEGAR